MLKPITCLISVLRNHNKSRWANHSRRRCGVKLRGLLFTLPLESLYEKKDPETRPVTWSSTERSHWPKPQRRRSDGGGVGSLEWHNYNKFELATRGKFEILLNNNLPLNPALLALHAFWWTCDSLWRGQCEKGGAPRKLFSVYSFLRLDPRRKRCSACGA